MYYLLFSIQTASTGPSKITHFLSVLTDTAKFLQYIINYLYCQIDCLEKKSHI